MRFSARLEAGKGPRAQILEDAPRKTRIGFTKGILGDFVGISKPYYPRSVPLDALDTHQAFIALIRDEADPWDYDNHNEWIALTEHLKECTWGEFYDFVELLGKLLQKKDEERPFDEDEYFKSYLIKVNSLFQEDGIGWNLNDRSELVRQNPSLISKKAEAASASLRDEFEPARIHYLKATTYLYKYPIDEANSIKEIISAVESVARVIEPKATTLGSAIKSLRKDTRFSSHMVDALEHLYVYGNATPQVRHGHATLGKPLLAEAELAYTLGIAFILYLIKVARSDI
jgi:hypothetical protein